MPLLRFTEVEVIDDDLGISGGGVHRDGFERLLAAVCNKSVGLVLAIEASRLALTQHRWCAVERRVILVGANPTQQLSLRLVAARAVRGGNEMD